MIINDSCKLSSANSATIREPLNPKKTEVGQLSNGKQVKQIENNPKKTNSLSFGQKISIIAILAVNILIGIGAGILSYVTAPRREKSLAFSICLSAFSAIFGCVMGLPVMMAIAGHPPSGGGNAQEAFDGMKYWALVNLPPGDNATAAYIQQMRL